MMFANLDAANWRDYAKMNQWVVRASFPSLSMEFLNDWRERAALGRVFVFDRVVLADRAAAMNGEMYLRTQRTAAACSPTPLRDACCAPCPCSRAADHRGVCSYVGLVALVRIAVELWGTPSRTQHGVCV